MSEYKVGLDESVFEIHAHGCPDPARKRRHIDWWQTVKAENPDAAGNTVLEGDFGSDGDLRHATMRQAGYTYRVMNCARAVRIGG